MEFTQKDELGLERTYYVVTQLELDGEEYYIYTDLVKSKNKEFRLLVGQTDNGKVIRVEPALEQRVIDHFTILESNFKKYLKETL